MELVDTMNVLEWFADNYTNFGVTLEIVSDKSQEGSQFAKGFGGIGGTGTLFNISQHYTGSRGFRDIILYTFVYFAL